MTRAKNKAALEEAPLADADQLSLDLQEERQRNAALMHAMAQEDEGRARLKEAQRFVRSLAAELKRLTMNRALIVSGQRRTAKKKE